jgi:hypothetical protein
MLNMKHFTLKILLVISFFLICFPLFSQKIDNVRREIQDGEVIIHYDLLGADTSQVFEVRLYSIIENYKQRLYRGEGDIGRDIKAGTNKRIIWNNKEELTSYRVKDMDFELEITIIYSPIIFKSPISNAQYKRGNPVRIDWIGGENFEKLRVELFQNNVKIRNLGSITNRGSHVWKIPNNLSPDAGYQIKLTRESKSDDGTFTPKFAVTRRIPTYIKLIPAAAVGVAGLTYLIISNIGGGGKDTDDDILPAPVNPR